ncbi:MAG: hypothetical protein J6Q15_00280, partial [Clostridia bacterium]|nr:hypothetical protein [Clostridia bacterium]
YYIVLTVDNSNINTVDNNATIDLAQFVTIWSYNPDDGFVGITNPNGVIVEASETNIVIEGSLVKLKDVNTLTKNQSAIVTIKHGGIGREIELYFNIKINSKLLSEGYMVDPATGDKVVTNAITLIEDALTNKMEGGLTIHDIENDINLKKSLLTLITFDAHNVSVDPYSNEYNYFDIELVKDEVNGEYVVNYMYDDNVSTYSRTLKIKVPAVS